MSSQIIKIVHLIPHLAISGGIENYIRNLCSISPYQNLQVTIITFFNDNNITIADELDSKGYSLIPLKKAFFENLSNRYKKFLLKNIGIAHFKKLNQLKKILKNISPDIIYAHGEDSELISGFLTRHYKIVNVIHGECYFPLNFFFRFVLFNISRKKYYSSIFVNEKLAKQVRHKDIKYYIVRPGIDVEKFKQEFLNRDYSNHKFTLGFLGRIVKEKGIYILIDSYKKLLEKFPDVHLIIGGTGKEYYKLQKLINKLGISDKVELKGEITDPKEFYKRLDLFILPSESEGLPLTILEALASGVPVIAANVGGISEVVKHNFNGRLIDGNSPDDFSDAISEMINSSEKLNLLKSNCISSVSNYNIQNFVKKFYSTLE